MVMGESIRMVMDYVSKKKGIEGLNSLIDEVNRKSVIFVKESDIKRNEKYPGYYLARVLDASAKIFTDEEMREMGEYFGSNMDISFNSFLGLYPPRKSVQIMVIGMRRYLPILHTGYRTITRRTYWIGVSKLRERYAPFVDGVMKSMFERHGRIAEVKKNPSQDRMEYILKF